MFNRTFQSIFFRTLSHWAIEPLSQNISILEKIAKKWKITNFSLEPLYDWIWSKCHQLTCFHTFLCIYDEYLRKKLKIFHFHFFLLFVIFWDFGNMSHMITRYEKTADFLAQMAFGSSTRSYWFPKLKKIWSDNSKIV